MLHIACTNLFRTDQAIRRGPLSRPSWCNQAQVETWHRIALARLIRSPSKRSEPNEELSSLRYKRRVCGGVCMPGNQHYDELPHSAAQPGNGWAQEWTALLQWRSQLTLHGSSEEQPEGERDGVRVTSRATVGLTTCDAPNNSLGSLRRKLCP